MLKSETQENPITLKESSACEEYITGHPSLKKNFI